MLVGNNGGSRLFYNKTPTGLRIAAFNFRSVTVKNIFALPKFSITCSLSVDPGFGRLFINE